MKIQTNFILDQYRSGIGSYSDFTKEVGLWESEKVVFKKYLKNTDKILDLGCGTGRTTFPLYQLGFQDLIGVDLTPEMIAEAKQLNDYFETAIPFQIGNACALPFAESTFDSVIFSFNGIMSIPNPTDRELALKETNRVLKTDGIFIFTTHDREKAPEFLDFWKAQKELWRQGLQNPQLYEFGDIIAFSKNESREIFIHIPDKQEVENWLTNNGFKVVETFYRSDQFDESEKVKEKSGECRFWIVKKVASV